MERFLYKFHKNYSMSGVFAVTDPVIFVYSFVEFGTYDIYLIFNTSKFKLRN